MKHKYNRVITTLILILTTAFITSIPVIATESPTAEPSTAESSTASDSSATSPLIPDPFVVEYTLEGGRGDFTPGQTSDTDQDQSADRPTDPAHTLSAPDSLPTTYDLRNVDGKNYLTPLKDQGSLNLCWAFATIENAETLLMLKNPTIQSNPLTFSIRQLDYATSTDGLYDPLTSLPFDNSKNASHALGGGGNFFVSSLAAASGIALAQESTLPWDESLARRSATDILDTDQSAYEINSTLHFPTITSTTASASLIESYVSALKATILEYGGPFLGTYSPVSTCGFTNTDDQLVLKTDDCINYPLNRTKGHAMQIIGWDDDYEYAYCDTPTGHTAAHDGACSSGTYTTGRGAWLLRNSWDTGDARDYPRLTYDSTNLTIAFTTDLSSASDRTWTHNYYTNPWLDHDVTHGIALVDSSTQSFTTDTTHPEQIEKIKFLAGSTSSRYRLTITTATHTYTDLPIAEVSFPGIYTFDLSNLHLATSPEFSVRIEGEDGAIFGQNSIFVFTSTPDYIISDYRRDDTAGLLSRIPAGTTEAVFRSHFTLDSGYTLALEPSTIATGTTARILRRGATYATYILSVTGDINGDAKVSSADYIKIRKHIMGTDLVTTPAFALAADVNSDSKISSADYIKIRKYIMNGEQL